MPHTIINRTGNPIAKQLAERRANVIEQATALTDRVADEGREFTADEQQQWDRLHGEIRNLDNKIAAQLDADKRYADMVDGFGRLTGGRVGGDPAEGRGGITPGLREFLLGEPGAPETFRLAPDQGVSWRQHKLRAERRDLNIGTAADGGDLVETSFYTRMVEHLIDNAAILQVDPLVLRTSGGNPIVFPKTTTHPTATLEAEAGTIAQNDPAFGQVTLSAFKYAELVLVSRELVEDQFIDGALEDYLARRCGEAVGNAFGTDAILGTGTGEPRGIATDATVGKTAPTGLTTTFGDQSVVGEGGDVLIDLFHSVIAPYRRSRSAYWMMNDATAAELRKLKNSQGDYVWQNSLVVGQPDTILGRPVVFDPNVAVLAADALTVFFGDWSRFAVRFAGPIEFVRSNEFAFDTDQIAFRCIMRADCSLIDLTGAVKVLQMAAS